MLGMSANTQVPSDQTSLKLDKDDKAHISYCQWHPYYLNYISDPNPSGYAEAYVQPTVFLEVSPNPVQVNQTVTINMSFAPSTPIGKNIFSNLTLEIKEPKGNTSNLGPFQTDHSSSLNLPYIPTQAGNYSMQIKYPGQIFNSATFFSVNNVTYYPTQSNLVTLKVQLEPVLPPEPAPSPTPTSSSTTTLKPTPTPKANFTVVLESSQTDYTPPTGQENQQDNGDTYLTDKSESAPYTVGHSGSFSIGEVAIGTAVGLSIFSAITVVLKKIEG